MSKSVSRSVLSDSAASRTVTCQAPLCMGFSRPEYWSGLPFPSLGDLFKPGIEPGSPALQENSLHSEPPGKPSPNRREGTCSTIRRVRYSGMKVKVKSLGRVRLFVTPWTVIYQASLSMGISRHEYWSGLPFLSAGDLPDPGIEPKSPAL